MTVDTETPDAQVDEENPPVDAGDSEPPSTEEPTSPSAADERDDQIQELRNRLSQAGRQNAELRNAQNVLTGQLTATNARLEALGAQLSQKEQREQDAYLNTLAPQDRKSEELRLNNDRLERRLSAIERERTAPKQPTEQEQQEATVRRAQQIALEASDAFGLEGDEQITWNDPRIQAAGGWESPDAYRRVATRLARKIANGTEPPQGETDVADKKATPKKAAATPPNQPTDLAKMAADAAKAAVAEVLGTVGGAPNSPRPAAIVPERTPGETAYQQTLMKYSPTTGPRATKEALKQQLAKAEADLAKAQK